MRQICEIVSNEGYVLSIIADSSQQAMVNRTKELVTNLALPFTFSGTTQPRNTSTWKQDTKEMVMPGGNNYNVIVSTNNNVVNLNIKVAGIKSAYVQAKRLLGINKNPYMLIYDLNQKPNPTMVSNLQKVCETQTNKKSSKQLAKQIAENKDNSTLQKILTKAAIKIKDFPVLGPYAEDIILLFAMIEDCVKGNYKEIPVGTMVAIIAVIIYFISPVDIIPDAVPVVGQLDDASVLVWALKTFHSDIEEYKAWKNNR